LVSQFQIIVIDIPGMGFNSRNEYLKKFKTFDEYMNYYMNSLNYFFGIMGLK